MTLRTASQLTQQSLILHHVSSYSVSVKAELPLEGIIFALNFLPWKPLLVKKLEIGKTNTVKYSTFKTDIIRVVLVFSISNFFTSKN